MSSTVWIFIAIAVLVAVFYLITVRVLFKESKQLDKKIDYSKMKQWKDDED